ncbi:MAG TPA: hypothetical protein VGR45_06905 [Stellaceae bacterium]|nr:hypothetical protein [Stellaceae bacterium]
MITWLSHIVMVDVYTSEINQLRKLPRSARERRLGPAAAVFAILALSLLSWAPVLLPVLIFVHG